MSLTAADSGGGEFTITPEGQYIGRCYRILDLGTQSIKSSLYGDSEKHQVMISWELIGTDDPKMEDGRPFSVSKTYTVSLHEKAKLRADLEAWRGKKFTTEELAGFDLSKVLGQYCIIQVVHTDSNDRTFANVQTIMAYKGEKPEPVNPDLVFDIDEPDMQIFETLSDTMKAKISNTPEWAKFTNPPKPAVSKPKLEGVGNKGGINKEATIDDIKIEDLEDEEVSLDNIPF